MLKCVSSYHLYTTHSYSESKVLISSIATVCFNFLKFILAFTVAPFPWEQYSSNVHIEAATFVIFVYIYITPKQIIIFHIECVVGFIRASVDALCRDDTSN